jgi:serine/threonine protein phosphatase PrpC
MADYEIFTEPGSRKVNEDYVLTSHKKTNRLFVLADGLGGHGRGDEASRFVAREMERYFQESDNFIYEMDKAFTRVQQLLLAKQEELGAKYEMKSTLVVLLFTETEMRWGFIGDSRLYVFNGAQMVTRTLDHSVPQRLALSRDIKEEEIRFHPDRNKLLRVMGGEWASSSFELSPIHKKYGGMSYLLCSDGFWELITEKEMEATLSRTADSTQWLGEMIKIVRMNGINKDMDNFSAIAVRF